MAIEILLHDRHLRIAETEARRRQSFNESKKFKGRNNAPSKGYVALDMHKLGCIGEVAAAIYLNLEDYLFQNSSPVQGSADLLEKIEIKTRSKYNYDLLIQLDDNPNKLFVLMVYDKTISECKVKLVGWCYGFNVMQKEYIREFVRGRPCYAIPRSQLNPPETLKVEVSQSETRPHILRSDQVWLSQNGDEILLNFNTDLMLELGWEAGDMLLWTIDEARNCCCLRKKQ